MLEQRLKKIKGTLGGWHTWTVWAYTTAVGGLVYSYTVRRILLLVVWLLVLNASGSLPKEDRGAKFSAPRQWWAGNAYAMTSSVESVEVLARVLIVLSISYEKVSTIEADAWSCSTDVATSACVKLYRELYGVERGRETTMEEGEM